jgi:hypothetical protein
MGRPLLVILAMARKMVPAAMSAVARFDGIEESLAFTISHFRQQPADHLEEFVGLRREQVILLAHAFLLQVAGVSKVGFVGLETRVTVLFLIVVYPVHLMVADGANVFGSKRTVDHLGRCYLVAVAAVFF